MFKVTHTHSCKDGVLIGVCSQLSTINEEGSLVGMETSSAQKPPKEQAELLLLKS